MKFVFAATAVVVALACGAPVSVLADETLPGTSVESLLAVARERNLDTSALRQDVAAATEREVPAGALMAPRLKVEWEDVTKAGAQNPTLLPSDVGSAIYTLTQDLPWMGKRDLKREIAAQETQAAQGRVQLSWADTAARIKALFAQRYLVQGTQRLVSENLELLLQLEKILQSRYAVGLATQQDITRIQVEHTGLRLELAALAGEWRQTQSRLNGLLARPQEAPLAPPAGLRPLPEPGRLDYQVLSERLRVSSPQLMVASALARSAEKNNDLARKNRYPDFTVGINAMQRQGTVNQWGLMLELNLPIQGDVLRAQRREAQATLAAAQGRQEAALNQALTDLADNLAALDTARQSEHLMTFSLMPQAELSWGAALAGYENGKADFATLLEAQRQIRTARLGQLRSQVDAQLRLADIERLVGDDE